MRKLILVAAVLVLIVLGVYCLWPASKTGESGTADPFDDNGSADKTNRISPQVLKLLSAADHFELFSLEPHANSETPATGNVYFCKFRVLGKMPITEQTKRIELIQALEKSVSERTHDDPIAACFDPRHGIHATLGAEYVDLVICFECEQTYISGTYSNQFLRNSGSAASIFNNTLNAAGIPLDKH